MKKSNFSDIEPLFFLFGGVVTKNAFSKMFLTFRYAFFDTNLILWRHPQQVFYDLKNQFLKIFGKSIIFLIFWMFLHHPSKFGEFSLKIGGEIICQSWPLLTLFFNFRIVQCDFASTQAGNSRIHLITHSGEKSNKCNQCNITSTWPANMWIHSKSHSGKKS